MDTQDTRAGSDGSILAFRFRQRPVYFNLPDPDDYIQVHMRQRKMFFEYSLWKAIFHLVPERPHVVDVGAYIGDSALLFTRLFDAAKVIAIEPGEHQFDLLCKNIDLNYERGRIVPLKVVIGKDIGMSKISATDVKNTGATMYRACAAGEQGTVRLTLDYLLSNGTIKDVNLLKIDVEGGEVDVLTGALALVRRFMPMIVAECWRPGSRPIDKSFDVKSNRKAFFDLVEGLGYEVIAQYGSNVILLPRR